MSRKLGLDDIADLRAYERSRDVMRERVIAMRRARRVPLGPLVSVAFENRETVRYQVQEMIRIERTMTDEGVAAELEAYNPLIPEPGQLCATVFVELTDESLVREWLPRLAGLENSIVLDLVGSSSVPGRLDAGHAAGLTRPDVTAAVHYLVFDFAPAQVESFARDGGTLASRHPEYEVSLALPPAVCAELLADLRP